MLSKDFGSLNGGIVSSNTPDNTLMFTLSFSKAWRPTLIVASVAQVTYPVPIAGDPSEPIQARLMGWLGTADPGITLVPAGDNILSRGGVIRKRLVDATIIPNEPFSFDLSRSGIVIGPGDVMTVALGQIVLRDGTSLGIGAGLGSLAVYGAPNDPDAENTHVLFR